MNVFATSPCPIACAQALDDKRVGKMLMEANQLLSNAVRTHSQLAYPKLCRPTHMSHPLTKWTARSRANFMWVLDHADALAAEWEHRFGKTHGSSVRNAFIRDGFLHQRLPRGDVHVTGFCNCARNRSLGIDFAHMADVHEAYRLYLERRWQSDARPPKWTRRSPPKWLDLEGTAARTAFR